MSEYSVKFRWEPPSDPKLYVSDYRSVQIIQVSDYVRTTVYTYVD